MSCRDNFISPTITFSHWKGREAEKDMSGFRHLSHIISYYSFIVLCLGLGVGLGLLNISDNYNEILEGTIITESMLVRLLLACHAPSLEVCLI